MPSPWRFTPSQLSCILHASRLMTKTLLLSAGSWTRLCDDQDLLVELQSKIGNRPGVDEQRCCKSTGCSCCMPLTSVAFRCRVQRDSDAAGVIDVQALHKHAPSPGGPTFKRPCSASRYAQVLPHCDSQAVHPQDHQRMRLLPCTTGATAPASLITGNIFERPKGMSSLLAAAVGLMPEQSC